MLAANNCYWDVSLHGEDGVKFWTAKGTNNQRCCSLREVSKQNRTKGRRDLHSMVVCNKLFCYLDVILHGEDVLKVGTAEETNNLITSAFVV